MRRAHYIHVEMLSLKNLWSSGQPTAGDYVRSLRVLLESLSVQPEELASPEIPVLREEVLALANTLTVQTTGKQLEAIVDGAIESLGRYTLSSAARVASHLGELKTTMRALTETVAFLSESRSSVVHQLTFIERQIEQASELEDIRLLRPKLMKCLELVREETARLQNESAVNSELIRSGMGAPAQLSETPRRVGSLDPVTGLPARLMAQRLIEDKINAGKECVIALFMPDRLESINRHHGRNAGDEVLLQVAQHLVKSIQPPASICRWGGPAFLALVEASERRAEVSRAWKTAAAKPIQVNIQIERRSVMVSVSSSCFVKITDKVTVTADLFAELDKVVASHVS